MPKGKLPKGVQSIAEAAIKRGKGGQVLKEVRTFRKPGMERSPRGEKFVERIRNNDEMLRTRQEARRMDLRQSFHRPSWAREPGTSSAPGARRTSSPDPGSRHSYLGTEGPAPQHSRPVGGRIIVDSPRKIKLNIRGRVAHMRLGNRPTVGGAGLGAAAMGVASYNESRKSGATRVEAVKSAAGDAAVGGAVGGLMGAGVGFKPSLSAARSAATPTGGILRKAATMAGRWAPVAIRGLGAASGTAAVVAGAVEGLNQIDKLGKLALSGYLANRHLQRTIEHSKKWGVNATSGGYLRGLIHGPAISGINAKKSKKNLNRNK